MQGLLRPEDLNQISVDAEMEKMDDERKLKQKKEHDQAELREAFSRVTERVNHYIDFATRFGVLAPGTPQANGC